MQRLNGFVVLIALTQSVHAAVISSVFDMPAGQTSAALVVVGNVANAADTRNYSGGFGAVNHLYSIGKYEVTAGQYTQFLNAVGKTDSYGIYTSQWNDYAITRSGAAGNYSYVPATDYANRALDRVTYGQGLRFLNWLTNGQPVGNQDAGTTEDGSYLLNGAMSDAQYTGVVRKAAARFVMPTDDEWYKAAYHKNDGVAAHYWDYSTASNAVPGNDVLAVDNGNTVNYWRPDTEWTLTPPVLVTPVGEFENSLSAYGTYDQGGNVREWNETDDSVYHLYHGIRGGYFGSTNLDIKAGLRYEGPATLSSVGLGFRIAWVPEPGAIGILAALMLLVQRRR